MGSYFTNSTKIEETLHAVESLAHRHGFHPSTHYTDTWPSDKATWNALWVATQGKLDIFHWLKRITGTYFITRYFAYLGVLFVVLIEI